MEILLDLFLCNSNTTLVKVKFVFYKYFQYYLLDSNTTLVKVKWTIDRQGFQKLQEFKYNTC